MTSLHKYGDHFKQWRLRRGYSLKEAAGAIVSPQFLSQFEKQQKSITIDKLSRLLMAIGVDVADFMMSYDGPRLEMFNRNYDKMITEPEHYLAELLPHYADNPEFLDLLDYCLKLIANDKVISLTAPKSLPAHKIEQLLELRYWNLLELQTIFILVDQDKLNQTQVVDFTYNVLHLLEESTTGKDKGGAHIVDIFNQLLLLTRLIRQLSRFQEYDLTLATINKIRKLVNSIYTTDLMFMTILLQFDILEVYTWLRMHDLAKAQTGYHRIMDYLNATITYDINPQLTETFIGYRETFQLEFQRLLKEVQNNTIN